MSAPEPPEADPYRRPSESSLVIDLPAPLERPDAPTVQGHAKRFVLALTLIVLTGAGLLALPWTTESGDATPPIDAVFTAVSAATDTGLLVVETQGHWNLFGEIVILILIQIGGLGFMVGASVVIASLGRSMTLRDSLMLHDGAPTLSLQEAIQLSRRTLRFIFVCEAVGFVILTAHFLRYESVPVAIWQGLFTAVSGFCNAGFDLQPGFQSLSAFQDSYLFNGTVILLIQAGALSYIALGDAWAKRRWHRFALDTKLVLVGNLVLLAGGMLMFLTLEWNQSLAPVSEWSRPMAALFQSASVRTAGFSTIDISGAHQATSFLSIGLMLVGGAAGSTTGGVKIATMAVIAIAVLSTVRGQSEAQAFGRRIGAPLVFRALAVTSLFLFAHFLITLTLAITEDVIADRGFGFLPIMSEAMSALSTTGISMGITTEISDYGKVVLIVAMYVGRLGPLTAVYALQRRQRRTAYRYPESQVRIG